MGPRNPAASQFPYFQYTSLLGTHTLLLVFTAIFLPAGTVLITPLPPQQSSLDKPQYRLLEPITANPVWTLLWLCAGTVACQSWWAGWMRQLWATYPHQLEGGGFVTGKDTGGGIKVDSQGAQGAQGKIQTLRNAWTNTILASGLCHVVIVLFGAFISSYIVHTYLLSLLLSILTVFVPSYTLSLPIPSSLFPAEDKVSLQWIRLFIQRKLNTAVERALVFPVLGSFLGCWAGAFPIPLDWDRPWQSWPLTPAYGALAGYLIGSWSSLIVNAILFLADEDALQQPHTVPETGTKPAKKRVKKKRE